GRVRWDVPVPGQPAARARLRHRAGFARVLAAAAAPPAPVVRPRRGYLVPAGLAAAALALATGIASLFVMNGRLRREVVALRGEQDALRRRGEEVARELEALGQRRTEEPAPPTALPGPALQVVSLRLLSGGARGASHGQELGL